MLFLTFLSGLSLSVLFTRPSCCLKAWRSIPSGFLEAVSLSPLRLFELSPLGSVQGRAASFVNLGGLQTGGGWPPPGYTSLAGWHGGWENPVLLELLLRLLETLFLHLLPLDLCD